MSLLRSVGVLVAIGAVAGCSQSPHPMATFIEDNTQGVLVAASHWQVLSKQTADKVFGCLEGLTYWDEDAGVHQPYCRQDVDQIRYTPIYVDRSDSAMPFAEAFYRDLQTEIVERGMSLALRPEGALELSTRIQLLDRPMPVPINAWPGMYTALGTGVFAIASGVEAALVGAGVVADTWANASSQGGAQVVITTTLRDGDRVVMSKSDAYFIEDADLAQYVNAAPAADIARPMKAGARPPELRTFTVVED
jgi:hypothetical protein